MKTNYTVPTLSSLEENGIKDLASIDYYLPELRLIQLTGVPVRIRIDKDYVELNSTENEINLDFYKPIFEKLMKFFYGIGYLFGFVDKNNKLTIYDIYTNDNYFSTRDMAIIEEATGLPIVKPIIEGFSFNDFISVLNKKINVEKVPIEDLFVLPSVYVNDTRSEIAYNKKETSTVILGEKPATYNYYNYNSYPTYPSVYQPQATVKNEVNTVKETKPTKTKKDEDEISTLVISLTKKDERANIFKETYKNVSNYINNNSFLFTKDDMDWWNKYGKCITYFYSIFTLPKTRSIVYEFAKKFILCAEDYSLTIPEKWAELFAYFFTTAFSFNKKISEAVDAPIYFAFYFSIFFEEELINFNSFYIKENGLKDDWRFGENDKTTSEVK